MQNAGSYANYTHLSPKNLYLVAHSGKITLASCLSGESLLVPLLIREHKERNRASINTAAGLSEVRGAGEKEASPPFKTEMNALSSTAKLSFLGIYLDGVAANIAKALIALIHI